MKLTELISTKDKVKILLMGILTVIAGVVLGIRYNKGIDDIIIVAFIAILFFLTLMLMIINDYTIEESEHHVHDAVSKMLVLYGIGGLFVVAGYFFSMPIRFILPMSALLCSLVPMQYGLTVSLMMSVVLGLCTFAPGIDSSFNVLLCLYGAIFSRILLKQKYHFHTTLMILALSITNAYLYQYMMFSKVTTKSLLYGSIEGVSNIILVLVFLPFVVKKTETEEITSYARAMESDFPLLLFVKSLSAERYKRCITTAKICCNGARKLGFDDNLCACAGFYYDLCDNDEANSIQYAANLGRQNLLPIDVVRVLSQFHGEQQVISSKEAALVDLVYEAVLQIEKKDNKENDFGKGMAIHATFDRLSKSGRYDESGLSINKFLQLRDYIIQEVEDL